MSEPKKMSGASVSEILEKCGPGCFRERRGLECTSTSRSCDQVVFETNVAVWCVGELSTVNADVHAQAGKLKEWVRGNAYAKSCQLVTDAEQMVSIPSSTPSQLVSAAPMLAPNVSRFECAELERGSVARPA